MSDNNLKTEEDVFTVAEDLMIGNLKIVQSKKLYRFTQDSVLLSHFADCGKKEIVADFCAGSGIVGLNYYGLHTDNVLSVTAFELQKELCDLLSKSIKINNLDNVFSIREGRLQDYSGEFNGAFSLILCNPPYKKANSGEQGLSQHIALCRHEIAITLEEIAQTAAKMLAFKGRLCICQRAERLCDAICALRLSGLEPSRVKFVSARGKIYLVMIEAVKGVKRETTVEYQQID